MATRRRSPNGEPEKTSVANIIVSIIALAGIAGAVYYMLNRKPPPDKYEVQTETRGRLDAVGSKTNDPISVSNKLPEKK
jgi:hypothetical protein